MIELLGVLDHVSWPTWLAASGFLALLVLARLVAERARRRTYEVLLSRSEPQTLLIDNTRHGRKIVVYRGSRGAPSPIQTLLMRGRE
ncbi:hypothetical protein ACIA5G_52415 [Amycolatopsis sp. NPDC051758]|uniref:hypothetical protein n=1 Tax=Amycolatopsis sp. NPDC051758 TaxID=3363935 RepID=UPI0037A2C13C